MDNSNVLALKYRPTNFEDLIGQENATTTLTNAFKDKKLYQCLLFAGNYGCGKTSAARIIAAMDNCEKGPTTEPCGVCKMCREIFSGQSTDVKEINAASNNGIDDIRNIADFVSTRPLLARVKYVILDECHALSRQAIESALKILEEPPEGVRFILCTTDMHKMKNTIQSRCMPFRFVKVPWQRLAEHLGVIAKKEGIETEEGALKLAARLSDGSVRNSLRNLQLLLNFSKGKVTTDIAQQALGALDDSHWFALCENITATPADATGAIKTITGLFNKGQDANQILDGLSEHLRTLLVINSCSSTAGLIYLSEEEKKKYVHQIGRMSIDLVVEMVTLLHEVTRGLSFNISPQLLLETYVIKAIQANSRIKREEAAKASKPK